MANREDKRKKIRICILLTEDGEHYVSSGHWAEADGDLIKRAWEWNEPANVSRCFIFEMVLPHSAQVIDLGTFDIPNGEFKGSIKDIKIPSEVQLG